MFDAQKEFAIQIVRNMLDITYFTRGKQGIPVIDNFIDLIAYRNGSYSFAGVIRVHNHRETFFVDKADYDNIKDFWKRGNGVQIYFVDPAEGKVFSSSLPNLEETFEVNGRTYPRDTDGFHYWHQKQFLTVTDIPDDELKILEQLGKPPNEPDLKDLIAALLDKRRKLFEASQDELEQTLHSLLEV